MHGYVTRPHSVPSLKLIDSTYVIKVCQALDRDIVDLEQARLVD